MRCRCPVRCDQLGLLTATLTANGRKGTRHSKYHAHWNRSSEPSHVLDEQHLPRAQSAAPTWTGRTRTRASSPASRSPSGWRSTLTTSTGRTSTPATIGRADLDGQNVNQSFITGGATPPGSAVDGGHIYWANVSSGTIGRADLDGQNANQSFITGGVLPQGWRSTGATSTGRTLCRGP